MSWKKNLKAWWEAQKADVRQAHEELHQEGYSKRDILISFWAVPVALFVAIVLVVLFFALWTATGITYFFLLPLPVLISVYFGAIVVKALESDTE